MNSFNIYRVHPPTVRDQHQRPDGAVEIARGHRRQPAA